MDNDTELRPFRIEVPQGDLDDLRDRLGRTRWPVARPGDGWECGVPLDYLQDLVAAPADRTAKPGAWGEPIPPSGVPTGVIVFAHDVGIRRCVERDHNVVRWTDVDRGGHFAALEEPELLVDDVRSFFRSLR